MNRKNWVVAIVGLIIVAGAGFWGGTVYAGSKKPSFAPANAAAFAGRAGATFAGRDTAAGGATVGTILHAGNGSITIELPSSTSTTAQTGTKIVLVGASTQVSEMQSVPLSNLKAGQEVTVTGAANSDGSLTATSIEVLPARRQ